MAQRGKLIVIEGLDGSGKATQAQLLYEALRAEDVSVRKVSFPDYASDSSALVRMYLRGDFGTDPAEVNAYAASSFYAVDRYAGYKADWGAFYEGGGVIIADRYTTSNAVHQCSKLPEAEWDAFLDWLFQYEYGLLGIPAPDAVFYLEVDPDISQRLMTGRYAGDEGKKDIHERNGQYLRRSETAAAWCCEKLGWQVIHCTVQGEARANMRGGAQTGAQNGTQAGSGTGAQTGAQNGKRTGIETGQQRTGKAGNTGRQMRPAEEIHREIREAVRALLLLQP